MVKVLFHCSRPYRYVPQDFSKILFRILTPIYYVACSMNQRGKNKPNHALWLATQVVKMVLSCLLRVTHCVLQESTVRYLSVN